MANDKREQPSAYSAKFVHVEPTAELMLKKQLAEFAQVDRSAVSALSFRAQEKIKKKLVDMGHWGTSLLQKEVDTLASRLASDLQALKDADIDLVQLLRFFELVKDVFDNYMKHNDKGRPIPVPKGTRMLMKKTIDSRASVDMEQLTDVQKVDVEAIVNINNLVCESPVKAVFDTNHAITRPYIDVPGFENDLVLQEALKKYQSGTVDSRNHFGLTVGHTEHVVQLLINAGALEKKMRKQNKWRIERESMVMIGASLIIYRVEWSSAEYCPIYGHFEKKPIGQKRGNVDWFICNTIKKSYIWVPDLVVYQVGLFGFLHGPESPYRFDMAGYHKTVVEAYAALDCSESSNNV